MKQLLCCSDIGAFNSYFGITN